MRQRKKQFLKNTNLESLLIELNGLLSPVQDNVTVNFHKPEYPVVFIVGCARAGSTLLMQWLANTGEFAYPTNFISRFYSAPFIGAKIQQMLTDPKYRFKDEFLDLKKHAMYKSELGKTSGLLAPNEFYYFWRRFFKFGEVQYLDKTEISKIDIKKFCSELASLQAVFEKPLAMKGHIINWNISFISRIIPNSIFVHVKRKPIFNAQSLIEAREKFYGDLNEWYSFKPIEYPMLKELDPYKQVAGQVYFTNRAIHQELSKIPSRRQLEINYEEFCKSPSKIYEQLGERLAFYHYNMAPQYNGPKKFSPMNKVRVSSECFKRMSEGYEQFQGFSA